MQSSTLNIKKEQDITYISFPNFDKMESINHLFSTRLGGVSRDHLASMNLSFQRGDDPQLVLENYKRIAKLLGCELNDFVASVQTHTDNIRIVTSEDKGKGIQKECDYIDIDGLITKEKGIVLVTYFADCVPIFFADEIKGVIGVAHSGYRGTLLKIGKKMIECMVQDFGCERSNIQVAIGPSICKDCYEVGGEVAREFQYIFNKSQHKDIIYSHLPELDKWKVDLWKANEIILKEAGILEQNLVVTDVCTCCNKDILFSHRGSQGKRGNLGAFITQR